MTSLPSTFFPIHSDTFSYNLSPSFVSRDFNPVCLSFVPIIIIIYHRNSSTRNRYTNKMCPSRTNPPPIRIIHHNSMHFHRRHLVTQPAPVQLPGNQATCNPSSPALPPTLELSSIQPAAIQPSLPSPRRPRVSQPANTSLTLHFTGGGRRHLSSPSRKLDKHQSCCLRGLGGCEGG